MSNYFKILKNQFILTLQEYPESFGIYLVINRDENVFFYYNATEVIIHENFFAPGGFEYVDSFRNVTLPNLLYDIGLLKADKVIDVSKYKFSKFYVFMIFGR